MIAHLGTPHFCGQDPNIGRHQYVVDHDPPPRHWAGGPVGHVGEAGSQRGGLNRARESIEIPHHHQWVRPVRRQFKHPIELDAIY